MSVIDHIVIVAGTLAEGCDHCERLLGVRPPAGGVHAGRGTHNHLLLLGEGTYLEVIAPQPDVTAPARPRLFGLDDAAVRRRLQDGPFLSTFVVRTDAIERDAARLPEVGPVETMSRGALQWRIATPADGLPVEGGLLPSLIEWPVGIDPTRAMQDFGIRLAGLRAHHPDPSALRAKWAALGLADPRLLAVECAEDAGPWLEAILDTPSGRVTLSGRTGGVPCR